MQENTGGEQRLPTTDAADRDAVSPSLDRSGDGTGSRKEGPGGAVVVDPTAGQLDRREQVWDVGPSRELSITAAEGLCSPPFLGQPKIATLVLKGRHTSDIFSKQNARVHDAPRLRERTLMPTSVLIVGRMATTKNRSWLRGCRDPRTRSS